MSLYNDNDESVWDSYHLPHELAPPGFVLPGGCVVPRNGRHEGPNAFYGTADEFLGDGGHGEDKVNQVALTVDVLGGNSN